MTDESAPPGSLREKLDRLAELISGRPKGAGAADLLRLLADTTSAELDTLLAELPIERLVRAVEDQARGARNRSELLHLLGRKRLPDLRVGVRAGLIRALQTTRLSKASNDVVRDVFLGTHGEALTQLKNTVDASGDRHDLQELVFHDVSDAAVRDEILGHVASEAAALPPETTREVKILSDVDDTFYANWKDQRYPPKTVYPGVLSFYRELDRGPHEQPGREGDLAFITARPSGRGRLEGRTHQSLRKRGVERAVVLSGSFRNIWGNTSIATKKLENFTQYARLFPEYDVVFIGDSGQGDVGLGENMLATEPARVKAVFIHDVVDTAQAGRDAYAARRIYYFDTYVGAARRAAELGLVQPDGALRVAKAALDDLHKIAFTSPAQQEARVAELRRDLERLEAWIGRGAAHPPAPLPREGG